jgi:hypothetical protein
MTTTTIRLARGGHHDCADGEGCLFEWYNYLTRQAKTDDCPPGVSKILWRFGMNLNDLLPDDKRQQLARFLPNGADRLAGTAADGRDETRGYMALDWLIRTYTPAFLDLAGLTAEATALRDLRRIADLEAAQPAGPVVRDARDRVAAWAAAGAAAGDAAWDAAWDAAGAAAGDADRVAAGAAAWAVLAPTVAVLQESAIGLYDLMVTGAWPDAD